MAKGLPPLEVNIAELNAEVVEDEDDWEAELPPDFVLIGALGMEPKSLNDILLCSKNAHRACRTGKCHNPGLGD